jgi:hypothetical protein
MLVLKYTTFENDMGTLVENIIVPTIINKKFIDAISPLYTNDGRIFKNVSVLDYQNRQFRVVGNYKELNDKYNIFKNNEDKIGYK